MTCSVCGGPLDADTCSVCGGPLDADTIHHAEGCPGIAADRCPADPVGDGTHWFMGDHRCRYCGKVDMLRGCDCPEVCADCCTDPDCALRPDQETPT